MKTYPADLLSKLDSEQINIIQQNCDKDALDYLEQKNDDMPFLNAEDKKHLREYYTDTMEKYRLLYEAIVSGFSTPNKTGFPEAIHNINLKDGSIETNKNGRRISYSTEILAPCTSALLHYINGECNDVYVIIPPIKSVERTTEKLITECQVEYQQARQNALEKFEEEPELPFYTAAQAANCPTAVYLENLKREQLTHGALLNIAKRELLPKDIYRLSITSKYPGDLEELIRELENNFPPYIKFEDNERNLYKENLSQNKRNYFDIKKTARITIPNSERHFYIEFQFKQTNMFFAHIRSHSAYEDFRVYETKYNATKEAALKKKTSSTPEVKAKLALLKKQCEEKRNLCLRIHRNAVHQSNLYLMHKLLWLDDNAHGLGRKPELPQGRYKHSVETLKKNYIVESYEPFDGTTAFTTSEEEYLNKSYYLKMIGILPESFDELGKHAQIHINKAWENLSHADIKDFDRITNIAIKYQDVVRSIQKEKQLMDNNALLNVLAQATGNSLKSQTGGR